MDSCSAISFSWNDQGNRPPLLLVLHLLHSNVQIFICQGIGIGNIVFMFHCLNWDHHLATVVHLWKKKGMNGKVGHASNLKSWWGHIIAQFQNGTDIFSFLKIMKKLNLRNYIDEDKERSYTVEGTLLPKFKWHWHEKIKITNKYFDEDTLLHIIAQYQNGTGIKIWT